ncbi:hypothetical protein V8C44DRAFT_321208 [Trichoderma aethiopicum]
MVTSSPDYSITKPGLHHLRKRAKPLRTYGRQPSAPETQSEPPLKKLRLSALKQQDQQQEEKPRSTPESSHDPPEREATPPAPSFKTKAATHDASPNQIKPAAKCAPSSKGSILSYFKPTPASSKPKDETQSPPPPPQESNPQPEDEQSTPPDSPPKRKQPLRRKPRLLKIKPNTHDPLDEPSEEQDESPHPSDETTPQSSTTLNAHTKASKSNTSASSTSTSTPPSPSSPSRKTSLGNHQKPRPSKRPPPSSSAVQTTLNISAKAAFSECKICDTVWNPLYPDDVKFHNKTHKAVLRAQRKRLMDEL